MHHDERQSKIRLNKETEKDIRRHHDLASAAQNPASAAQKPVASYTGPLKGIGMQQNKLPQDIILRNNYYKVTFTFGGLCNDPFQLIALEWV